MIYCGYRCLASACAPTAPRGLLPATAQHRTTDRVVMKMNRTAGAGSCCVCETRTVPLIQSVSNRPIELTCRAFLFYWGNKVVAPRYTVSVWLSGASQLCAWQRCLRRMLPHGTRAGRRSFVLVIIQSDRRSDRRSLHHGSVAVVVNPSSTKRGETDVSAGRPFDWHAMNTRCFLVLPPSEPTSPRFSC